MQESSRRVPEDSGLPREKDLAQKYANTDGNITTLMLRNVPVKYTQDMLLKELVDCLGSSDNDGPGFDFFYLPWDQQNNCNTGYAFVNFHTKVAADRCIRIFTNFNFRWFNSSKTCTVYPAHIQGLENNVLHLMDRAISEARSHYPIILWKGEKIKLGKVIAAAENWQQPLGAPVSTPGNFAGSHELMAGALHEDMSSQPMERRGNGAGGAADVFFEAEDSQGGHGSLEMKHPDRSPEISMLDAMPKLLNALLRQRKVRSSRFTPLRDGGSVPATAMPIQPIMPNKRVSAPRSSQKGVRGITFEGQDAPPPWPDSQSAGPSVIPSLLPPAALSMPGGNTGPARQLETVHLSNTGPARQFETVHPSFSQTEGCTINLPDPNQDVLNKFLMRFGV